MPPRCFLRLRDRESWEVGKLLEPPRGPVLRLPSLLPCVLTHPHVSCGSGSSPRAARVCANAPRSFCTDGHVGSSWDSAVPSCRVRKGASTPRPASPSTPQRAVRQQQRVQAPSLLLGPTTEAPEPDGPEWEAGLLRAPAWDPVAVGALTLQKLPCHGRGPTGLL